MSVKKVSWSNCEELWRQIETSNKCVPVYMYRDFMENYKSVYKVGAQRWNKSISIFEFTGTSGNRGLLPLLEDHSNIYICGDLCATGYLDFLYPENVTESDFNEMLSDLKIIAKGRTIRINKINEKSLLFPYLSEHYPVKDEMICVNIALPETIEDYYGSLSKSCKQNYRTAKNRMAREEKPWTVEVYMNRVVPKNEIKDMMSVYIRREEERQGKSINPIVRLVQGSINPITKTCFSLPNAFVSCLRICGNVAGFLAGYVSNDKSTIVVPRLAIDSEYGVYCPGTLLIYETIDWLIKNTPIRNLDLSRGEEKYKYVMGGTQHINRDFEIIS